MLNKTTVVISVFVTLILCYFVFMMYSITKTQRKKEMFDEKAVDEKSADEKSKTSDDGDTKLLEHNLYIINVFEEVHGSKITPHDLKQLSKLWKDAPSMTNEEMKKHIKEYKKKETFAADNSELVKELTEITKRLAAITQDLNDGPKAPPATDNKEHFAEQGIMPFSNEKKFVFIR